MILNSRHKNVLREYFFPFKSALSPSQRYTRERRAFLRVIVVQIRLKKILLLLCEDWKRQRKKRNQIFFSKRLEKKKEKRRKKFKI